MPLKVLIAEDEVLVALDLAYMVEEAGYIVVGPCSSLAEVKKVAVETPPDLAVIDVKLGRDSGKDVCAYLHQEFGTTCVFVTAHPSSLIKNRFGALGSVTKPFGREDILGLLRYMEGIRAGKTPKAPRFLVLFS
jgi:AmiR/NasT family two-component response regulator